MRRRDADRVAAAATVAVAVAAAAGSGFGFSSFGFDSLVASHSVPTTIPNAAAITRTIVSGPR